MKSRLVLFVGTMLIMLGPTFGQTPEWLEKLKDIALMTSTRSDIERVFGYPENPSLKHNSVYRLKEGKLDIEYSRGKCSENEMKGWDVSELTVTRMFFFPKIALVLTDLGLNFTGFRKFPSTDVPGAFGYRNEEAGIDIDVTSKGKIEAIEFYPGKRYEDLYCKKKGQAHL